MEALLERVSGSNGDTLLEREGEAPCFEREKLRVKRCDRNFGIRRIL